ncbi:unnamed protein product [Peronospora farinosa]|uniref:Protein BIG1 n=1 Tax=Peronospora farinosa TaxID=134698 RepID=A0ABN8CCU1_9STRA|nr:unnamed protein product [Peronospora farinosa]
MHVLFQLSVAALAASIVSANHVLVLGKSSASLWHDTRTSAAFSSSGLANLALNSLGLPTGRFSSHSAVQSPLQADIFTHSEAYSLVILEDASISSLEAVNAALSDVNAFHELYLAQACKLNVPMAVAQKFQVKYPSAAHCAGNAALCSSLEAFTPLESEKLVHQVLETNSFLSASDDQDIVFAKQLAQVMQLTADMKQHGDEKRLYIVGISRLHGDKQQLAQQVVTRIVTDFLAQLMEKEQVVAAQVMMGELPTAVQQVAALSRRKLASGLTKEASDGKDEDEEEDDDADLTNASGGEWENNDNTTSATNSSAPGVVSMQDIAEYQIILWTSVLLGAVLLGAVLTMANMDAGRDSLLYAKFIADVNGRKTN